MPSLPPSDTELVRAVARGDDAALGALYDRHGRAAYALAVRILRDPALAEDAVQEAFLALWRQARTYDPSRAKVTTWLLTLVHRRSVDLVRSGERRTALAEQAAAAAVTADVVAGDAFADAAARHARREVRDALELLTASERRVIELAYYGGLSQSQIAATLGIPAGTVKSRTFAALAKLRTALEPALVEPLLPAA